MNLKKAILVALILSVFIVGAISTASAASTKVTLKVSAPKVTNEYKKSQTFKVTVKNKKTGNALKNVKANIKIGKKTFNKKTNKKGIISINTKSLKKGTYKVTIKIKASKKYKKASAKSTIKITSSKTKQGKLKTHFEFEGMTYNRAANGRLNSVSVTLNLVDEKGNVLKKPITGQMHIYYYAGTTQTYGPEASGTSGSTLEIFRNIGGWNSFITVDFKGDDKYEPASYRSDISI